ncbi:MAG: PTS fructose transporter subunit IIA [Deltaproteobacteria bacterium CG12_big_fil_rev_8_21_14_0_65_43_10]|nr:MAG: PTS fructose transporter subunit IIA [Deltaproteobacteria bacterium CG2_30_43_15]PIQ45906.1 MAG: PTS fructose transporter subunit IIA [Deltaproteobacteria bacterium CG12_big_fil_rev_8_21_14_0_65_43_10]PIU84265.1 MAG: PTS fructose transporter subunit IIA [Deltaproteobacteria bacterium CG06_land_8_20_14_3_00_44_19]
MKIADILSGDLIIPELTSKNKKEVLEELVSVIVKQNKLINKEELIEVLLEREQLGSTGIGDGIAIPHGKLKNIGALLASFGKSIDGVDFDSMDGKPTHLFFLLVAPENSAGIHLKALARISRLLKDSSFKQDLMEAKLKDDLFKTIIERDEK